MKHVIIGTAGHVDHGKTTLIRAMTGYDTDRLKEEKSRGISIELGFAPFDLPSGRRAGVVDVPGHERFIKNMLAGAGGIDLVLLVVAANESVMPQTLEHLHILNLLGIEKGVIAITKTDIVEEEWRELVQEEVREAVAGTFLMDAPVVPVSAVTGEGLAELKAALDAEAEKAEGKNAARDFRLPADRVFTVKGAGTVVTGTLVAGTIRAGDAAEIMPQRLTARVRQIQVHGNKVDEAEAGQRVAVNLAGVEVQEVTRGNVIVTPGTLHPTQALDAKLELLTVRFTPEPLRLLRNRTRIRFYTGTQEIMGRVVLLDKEEIQPGETAYVQFFLEEAAAVGRGDKFIIRSYSPLTTLGGGTVIEPYAKKHRRFREEVLSELQVKEKGVPDELLEQVVRKAANPFLTGEEIKKALPGLAGEMGEITGEMAAAGRLLVLPADNRPLYIHPERYEKLCGQVTETLERFHRQQPLKTGLPQEELRGKLFAGLSPRIFAEVLNYLAADGILAVENQKIRRPEHSVTFSPVEAAFKAKLEEAYRVNLYAPPTAVEVAAAAKADTAMAERVIDAMVEAGEFIRLSGEVVLAREAVEAAKGKAAAYITQNGSITLAEFRDLLQTSRKFVLPLLEYFDEIKFTRRVGDKRILGRGEREG
ncbi:MAG: selenocysteine-specific translation elongation factor [bacterium]|jgi:selenocysteine-specific elongation factor